jgi:AcrR family transcriptional regulator
MAKSLDHPLPANGRQRLIDAARRLFLQKGASNVGINEITNAANVARMTLYNNFESKEALTAAVYAEMAHAIISGLDGLLAGVADQSLAIEKTFEYFATGSGRSDYRGCPLLHASLQDANANGLVYRVAHNYKRELRARLCQYLSATANTDELADQILMLLDGAVTENYLKGALTPLLAAKKAALLLAAG